MAVTLYHHAGGGVIPCEICGEKNSHQHDREPNYGVPKAARKPQRRTTEKGDYRCVNLQCELQFQMTTLESCEACGKQTEQRELPRLSS